jgi:hypothetical protein
MFYILLCDQTELDVEVVPSKFMVDVAAYNREWNADRWSTSWPAAFRIYHGQSIPDLVDGHEHLVSGRLRELFMDGSLGKVMMREALLYDHEDCHLVSDDLSIVMPYRGSGPCDFDRGAMSTGHGDPWPVGLFFDHSTWTGQIVFRTSNYHPVIYTQEAVDIIRRAGIPQLVFEPVEQWGTFEKSKLNSKWGRS